MENQISDDELETIFRLLGGGNSEGKRQLRRQLRGTSKLWRERYIVALRTQDRNSLLYDPVEDDPDLKAAFKFVEDELKDYPEGFGMVHLYWAEMKRLLRDRFEIEWFSPAEMNPNADFD